MGSCCWISAGYGQSIAEARCGEIQCNHEYIRTFGCGRTAGISPQTAFGDAELIAHAKRVELWCCHQCVPQEGDVGEWHVLTLGDGNGGTKGECGCLQRRHPCMRERAMRECPWIAAGDGWPNVSTKHLKLQCSDQCMQDCGVVGASYSIATIHFSNFDSPQ